MTSPVPPTDPKVTAIGLGICDDCGHSMLDHSDGVCVYAADDPGIYLENICPCIREEYYASLSEGDA